MLIFLRIAKAALIFLQLAVLSGWAWLYFESRGSGPGPDKADTKTIDISKGRSVRTIAAGLKAEGILRKTTPFILLYEFAYRPQGLKAGEYRLPMGSSAKAVLETLIKGKVVLHPVTLAEGLTGREMIAEFRAAGFGDSEAFLDAFRETGDIDALDPKAKDLEGYLYPETYHLPRGITSREIFERMTAQFKAVFDNTRLRRAAELGLSVRQVVTLASLIEKETALPAEKRLVSAVFHNRMRIGMKLDCDPTIIYALKLKGPFEGRLRLKDLKYDSPYNTYLYSGLPPGPIANPGLDSMDAALHPEAVDYLYFVSKNDGSHQFSRTLIEHRRAVNSYQKKSAPRF
jgi:UPF0755 protein